MYPYTIEEFTEEVMGQLKGFVQEGDSVEFEIKIYNSDDYFLDKSNSKGLCVVCGSSDPVLDLPTLKYSISMK